MTSKWARQLEVKKNREYFRTLANGQYSHALHSYALYSYGLYIYGLPNGSCKLVRRTLPRHTCHATNM